MYYSQYSQDKFLNEKIFKNKQNGFFLDIGAHDGITFSNTYFFEKELGWNGICVEPMFNRFKELKENRNSILINACIDVVNGKQNFIQIKGQSDMLSYLDNHANQKHIERILANVDEKNISRIAVDTLRLEDVLKDNSVDYVDYCSIDVEGNELNVLKSINFSKVTIKVLSIENNYGDSRLEWFLLFKGYKYIAQLGPDNIYILQKNKSIFIPKRVIEKIIDKVIRIFKK